MVARKISHKIQAFTILEVTVVLAILGILITIISVSLNRFNEQLKLDKEIHDELNHWMLIRANLWKEYYSSDSIIFENKTAIIYINNREISYQEQEGLLHRKENENDWKNMEVEIESIQLVEENQFNKINFSFLMKGEVMELSYYCRVNKKNKVNSYYQQLNE